MINLPEPITGAWLNNLSPDERAEILGGPFGQRMDAWAASHVSYFRWTSEAAFGRTINNGSVFFLDLCGKLLAVTAAHVFEGYLSRKWRSRRILCQIDNVEFDPEDRLWGRHPNVDIATFQFSYEDLQRIGKQALVATEDSWPPPHPFSGQSVYVVGFPSAARVWTGLRSINFGLLVGLSQINVVADDKITCPIEREHLIAAPGFALLPEGYDLGGISGGPLLLPMEKDGVWHFCLGGVVSQAPDSRYYQTIVCVPAHFIAKDGRINNPSSGPIRHAIRAV
jgi:hypothetical protein